MRPTCFLPTNTGKYTGNKSLRQTYHFTKVMKFYHLSEECSSL